MANSSIHKCSFCRIGDDSLIAGPDVYICRNCVDLCKQIYETRYRGSSFDGSAPAHGSECNFCGNGKSADRTLFSLNAHFICANCLTLCIDAQQHTKYVITEEFANAGVILEIRAMG